MSRLGDRISHDQEDQDKDPHNADQIQHEGNSTVLRKHIRR